MTGKESGEKMAKIAEQFNQRRYQQGIGQGKKIGVKNGQSEGIEVVTKNIAQKLLMQKVVSVETIAHMTNLSVSAVIAIEKEMEGAH